MGNICVQNVRNVCYDVTEFAFIKIISYSCTMAQYCCSSIEPRVTMGSPCECLSRICRMGIIRKGSGTAREFAPKAVHMNRAPTLRRHTKNQTHPERNTGVTTRHSTVHIDFFFHC